MPNAAKIVKGHCNRVRIAVGGLRVKREEGEWECRDSSKSFLFMFCMITLQS
jgi:hypothetical protein